MEIDYKLIFINVITRHTGHWAMFNAFQGAASHAMGKGYRCMLSPHVGDSLVSRARNNSMGDFLESEAGWYFTLDDDVAIPPEALTQLIEADKDIIGGFYRLKKAYNKGDDLVGALSFRGKDSFILGEGDPVEVYHISNGCVMHKRKFIEDMCAHYPELEYVENISEARRFALYQPYIYNKEYLSEDWAFCQRAMDKGYKMYMHPKVLCDHWGLQRYGFENLLNDVSEQ